MAIVDAFWQALAPIELELLEQAQTQLAADAQQVRKARDQQLQRLRYHVRLAERQYRACDPDCRLVASELEHRWNEALLQLRNAEEQLQREENGDAAIPRLTSQMKEAWELAGVQLPQLWSDGRLTVSQKKTLLRSLIQKVVLQRQEVGKVHLRIVWKGGTVTEADVLLRVASWSSLSTATQVQAEILRMAASGLSDEWISYELSRQGYRSSYVSHVPLGTVARCRAEHRVASPHGRTLRSPSGWLSISQAARRTGIPASAIHAMILQGSLQLPVEEPSKRFLLPDNVETLEKLQKLHAGELAKLHLT